jgi:salicylate hydroxylase
MTKDDWTESLSAKALDADVVIIGAGPGGLAAAHALLRQGLRVKVFERAKAFRQIGAALGLFPNAYKALDAIDPALCPQVLGVGVEPTQQTVQQPNGEILFQGVPPFASLKEKYGYPFQWLGWFRLQSVLYNALPPRTVVLGRACTGYTPKSNHIAVHFQGHASVEAGLLVGADGINSVIRQYLLNDGLPCYRNTLSWRSVINNSLLSNVKEMIAPGEFRWISGEGKNFAIIDVGDGLTCWTGTALSPRDQWSGDPEQIKARVLSEFSGWAELVSTIVQATSADCIVERGIYDRPPVTRWSQGRVTLLGDAAHPMRPTLGQGTGMAFEDAYELSVCLVEEPTLEQALRRYETERIARTEVLQVRAAEEGERAYQADRAYQLAEASKNWTTDEFDNWLYNRPYRKSKTCF